MVGRQKCVYVRVSWEEKGKGREGGRGRDLLLGFDKMLLPSTISM